MTFSQVPRAIANVLRTSGAVSAKISSTGDTEAMARPHLSLTLEEVESPHPGLHSATLVFSYSFDADDVESGSPAEAAAAADLQSAVDHFLSDDGYAACRAAIRTSGIWLRRPRYPQPGSTTATGERVFAHEIRVPLWLQTII